MRECANCGAPFSESVVRCPYCQWECDDKKLTLPLHGDDKEEVHPIGRVEEERCAEPVSSADSLCFVACTVDGISGYSVAFCQNPVPEHVVIPDAYKGEPVLEIGERAFSNKSVQTVHLPPGLRRIQDLAFDGCEHLIRVTGCEGVLCVGKGAFRGCIHLEDVCKLLSPRVQCPADAFAGCYYLPVCNDQQ